MRVTIQIDGPPLNAVDPGWRPARGDAVYWLVTSGRCVGPLFLVADGRVTRFGRRVMVVTPGRFVDVRRVWPRVEVESGPALLPDVRPGVRPHACYLYRSESDALRFNAAAIEHYALELTRRIDGDPWRD